MIRFGMVGTGRITAWVLKGAKLDPRFRAEAICSRNEASGKAFASAHDIPKVYTTLEEMVADPCIDAVYLGTPNHTHRDLAILAMKQGKHVLCEKPLASNAREVREMIDTARSSGALLMEAMISTLNPNFLQVKRRLPEVGKIRHFFSAFCQYSSKYDLVRKIIAGESNAPVPSSLNPDCSGGALMDIGIYTLFPMVALFGKPSRIHACVTTCEVPVGTARKTVDLQGAVLFEYDGMTAEILYSKIADSKLRTEISGEDGILSLDQIHIARKAEFIPRGIPTSGRSAGPEAVDLTVPPEADEYLCEFREFIDLLERGEKESARNSLSYSLAVAEIMDEIRRQGGVVFPADLHIV